MKLLLDEMYPRLIVRELQALGHDVVSVHDMPGRGAADEIVFEYALTQGRAVVTENVRDYRPLTGIVIASGRQHCGIVFTTDKRWPRISPGAIITALDRLLKSTSGQPADIEIWL